MQWFLKTYSHTKSGRYSTQTLPDFFAIVRSTFVQLAHFTQAQSWRGPGPSRASRNPSWDGKQGWPSSEKQGWPWLQSGWNPKFSAQNHLHFYRSPPLLPRASYTTSANYQNPNVFQTTLHLATDLITPISAGSSFKTYTGWVFYFQVEFNTPNQFRPNAVWIYRY